MNPPRHINPDHFLQTTAGRVITSQRNALAWRQAYAALEDALRATEPKPRLFLLVGVQGAGKSSWVRAAMGRIGPDAVFFDAVLPARSDRLQALALAAAHGVETTAVWIDVPLQVALERNRGRAADECVPEVALRNVFAALEPPSLEEGFAHVHVVTRDQTRG